MQIEVVNMRVRHTNVSWKLIISKCSMSRKGDCLDHAVAERFFGSLKRERTAHGHDATRQEARDDVIDDIEMFYNSRRKHSYLGYVSPNEYEALAQVA